MPPNAVRTATRAARRSADQEPRPSQRRSPACPPIGDRREPEFASAFRLACLFPKFIGASTDGLFDTAHDRTPLDPRATDPDPSIAPPPFRPIGVFAAACYLMRLKAGEIGVRTRARPSTAGGAPRGALDFMPPPSDYHPHRIVVVGGGAAGLRACHPSRRSAWQAQTCRHRADRAQRTHLWKPLLHSVAAGAMDPSEHQLNYLAQGIGTTFAIISAR